MRTLIILGSTGSVGTQALDVVRRNPDRFKVVGLSAGSNHELLIGQIREFLPPYVAIADEEAARDLKERLTGVRGVEMFVGPEAAERLAREVEADMVLNALVGSAGLAPTLAALQSGKLLALANKESLVVGGELVMDLVKGEPERLIPVDSEHAALAQCLRGERREDVKRVILCSGKVFVDLVTSDEYARAQRVAVVRIEELYPFPADQLSEVLSRYPNMEEVFWVQEEPQNRGAWSFVAPRVRPLLKPEVPLIYVGRPERPSPAEGTSALHKVEQARVIREALAEKTEPTATSDGVRYAR